MWPVGLVTKTGVSSPIIRNGKLDGYYDGWIGGRKYPVDMAGFSVSVKFLHERPLAKMPFKPGYEEDGFLRSLAPLNNSEIELLADECREVVIALSVFEYSLNNHCHYFADTHVAHADEKESGRAAI